MSKRYFDPKWLYTCCRVRKNRRVATSYLTSLVFEHFTRDGDPNFDTDSVIEVLETTDQIRFEDFVQLIGSFLTSTDDQNLYYEWYASLYEARTGQKVYRGPNQYNLAPVSQLDLKEKVSNDIGHHIDRPKEKLQPDSRKVQKSKDEDLGQSVDFEPFIYQPPRRIPDPPEIVDRKDRPPSKILKS